MRKTALGLLLIAILYFILELTSKIEPKQYHAPERTSTPVSTWVTNIVIPGNITGTATISNPF